MGLLKYLPPFLFCLPCLGQPLLMYDALMAWTPPVAAAGSTPFITSFTTTTPRNDTTLIAGMVFTVGSSGITVTDLGRWIISGNSQAHTIYLSTSGGTVLGSGAINAAGSTAGTFAYVHLATPISLTAGTTYLIGSSETGGGDTWYDASTTPNFTTTAAAGTVDAAFEYAGTWYTGGSPGSGFVPCNFKYTQP